MLCESAGSLMCCTSCEGPVHSYNVTGGEQEALGIKKGEVWVVDLCGRHAEEMRKDYEYGWPTLTQVK